MALLAVLQLVLLLLLFRLKLLCGDIVFFQAPYPCPCRLDIVVLLFVIAGVAVYAGLPVPVPFS